MLKIILGEKGSGLTLYLVLKNLKLENKKNKKKNESIIKKRIY